MDVMMRWQPWYIVPFPKVNEQVNHENYLEV